MNDKPKSQQRWEQVASEHRMNILQATQEHTGRAPSFEVWHKRKNAPGHLAGLRVSPATRGGVIDPGGRDAKGPRLVLFVEPTPGADKAGSSTPVTEEWHSRNLVCGDCQKQMNPVAAADLFEAWMDAARRRGRHIALS